MRKELAMGRVSGRTAVVTGSEVAGDGGQIAGQADHDGLPR
jgi:hypothetical protein